MNPSPLDGFLRAELALENRLDPTHAYREELVHRSTILLPEGDKIEVYEDSQEGYYAFCWDAVEQTCTAKSGRCESQQEALLSVGFDEAEFWDDADGLDEITEEVLERVTRETLAEGGAS